MKARSDETKPPKPSAMDNMTRARAERIGLRVGAKVRQYLASYDEENRHKGGCKVKEGTVLEIWKHGFVVQLPNYKTFFRFNLLRCGEMGERVEILKGRNK